MSPEQTLFGVGLTLALAVGSQVLASRMRIPALIVLLPAGFLAGALTESLDPGRYLGPAFQPLVSLAVAVILYDAGLGLDLHKLIGHIRRVVVRLLTVGVALTWGVAATAAVLLLDMSLPTALLTGAILVVSGPTVVGPLLAHIRPQPRLNRILSWEGSLIDPIGAILAALVFHAVVSGSWDGVPLQFGRFATSVAVGLIGAAVGVALLWLLLRTLRLGEVLGSTAQLATVIVVAAACDIASDDTGLIAAIVMGVVVATVPGFDIAARRHFFEPLVQLILGVLFISISATVTPDSLTSVLWPALGLAAILVLLVRPLVALLSTVHTDLTLRERWFIGWMAPRGIVAAATASAFSAGALEAGVESAEALLPTVFLVIVVTVGVYGLTGAPLARLLGVTRSTRARPLLVGAEPWVIDLGLGLRRAGLEVLMWAGGQRDRDRIRRAGLALAPAKLLVTAHQDRDQVEDITAAVLLADSDDVNALAATILRSTLSGPVYRPPPEHDDQDLGAAQHDPSSDEVLLGFALARSVLIRRYRDGARITTWTADSPPEGYDVLFRVRDDGDLLPVTSDDNLPHQAGDTLVLIGPERNKA